MTNETCEHCLFYSHGTCCNYRSLSWCSSVAYDFTCDYFTQSEEDEAIQLRKEVEAQLG